MLARYSYTFTPIGPGVKNQPTANGKMREFEREGGLSAGRQNSTGHSTEPLRLQFVARARARRIHA